jgi:hypothetical protein
MTALSKLVSVSPNRMSVIFFMVCHRVPCCLQLFITSSLQMPSRSMGVSLLHLPMTLLYLCPVRTQRLFAMDFGSTSTLDSSKTQAIYFTRCWSPLRLPSFGNEQEIPWTPEVKYLVSLDKRLTFVSHTAKSIEKAERAFRIHYSFLNRKSKLCLHNKLLLYKSCIGSFCVTVSRHDWFNMIYASDHPEQVSQDNQKSPLAIFDISSPPGDKCAYDRCFWRKVLSKM